MSLKDSSLLQTIGIACGATVAVLSALAIKYHDRPLFYEHPKDIPFKKGYPLLGDLPGILANFPRLLDAETDSFEHLDALTM
jgi:fatty acid omega-hydroxylase